MTDHNHSSKQKTTTTEIQHNHNSNAPEQEQPLNEVVQIAQKVPEQLTHKQAMQLQRKLGNQAVMKLMRKKSKVIQRVDDPEKVAAKQEELRARSQSLASGAQANSADYSPEGFSKQMIQELMGANLNFEQIVGQEGVIRSQLDSGITSDLKSAINTRLQEKAGQYRAFARVYADKQQRKADAAVDKAVYASNDRNMHLAKKAHALSTLQKMEAAFADTGAIDKGISDALNQLSEQMTTTYGQMVGEITSAKQAIMDDFDGAYSIAFEDLRGAISDIEFEYTFANTLAELGEWERTLDAIETDFDKLADSAMDMTSQYASDLRSQSAEFVEKIGKIGDFFASIHTGPIATSVEIQRMADVVAAQLSSAYTEPEKDIELAAKKKATKDLGLRSGKAKIGIGAAKTTGVAISVTAGLVAIFATGGAIVPLLAVAGTAAGAKTMSDTAKDVIKDSSAGSKYDAKKLAKVGGANAAKNAVSGLVTVFTPIGADQAIKISADVGGEYLKSKAKGKNTDDTKKALKKKFKQSLAGNVVGGVIGGGASSIGDAASDGGSSGADAAGKVVAEPTKQRVQDTDTAKGKKKKK